MFQWKYLKPGHRLAPLDYLSIIAKGEPWTDPFFPPDKRSLFLNGAHHSKYKVLSKKKAWEDLVWMRASEYYASENFLGKIKEPVMFDNIEPEDVRMGECENCWLCATLSGLAERDLDEERTRDSFSDVHFNSSSDEKSVLSIFLTRQVNRAGCYAMKFCIDGEDRIIVVDDYFPMRLDKATGRYVFAFSKSNDPNEIWNCLVEKALAKICGSYEQTEHIKVSDCFYLLAGGPTMTYNISEFKMDIRRGRKLEAERFDKFYELINEAAKKNWVVTGSTAPMPKELIKKHGDEH